MFLEEELNTAFEKGADNMAILEILRNRLPDPMEVGVQGYENACKQIHFIWKRFCESHKKYNPNGFKQILLLACKDKENIYNHFNNLLK